MKALKKIKTTPWLLIIVLLFFITSLITLYSIQASFGMFSINLVYRQAIWFILGLIMIYFILNIENNFFIKYIWYFYAIGNVLLLGLLFFAEPINHTLRWYVIPYIGAFQPSEFMKIILVLLVAHLIAQFNQQYQKPTWQEELYFLLKIVIIVAIPSFLTFLQPDTGLVLIYIFATLVVLFIGGIRLRWFLLFFATIATTLSAILLLYFYHTDLFINLLGPDFFFRIDRLLDWSAQTGFQLRQGLIAIGVGSMTGQGIGNIQIYFPEPQTDFIFAAFANTFGFLGIITLFAIFLFFYHQLIKIALEACNYKNYYILAGFIGLLLYQQIQNIGMTFGLLPLTGITLPFISAGGSSLLSYMLILAITINIANEK